MQVGPVEFPIETKTIEHAEISLPRRVTSEQILGSNNFFVHDFFPESLDNLNDTAEQIWTSQLPSTPFPDITLEVTDLPTGQLAEAQLIEFDRFGNPTAGRLLIDHDANSIGWYIDSTPEESSEFAIPNTEFSATATPGSAAFGRYDLLTTLILSLFEPFEQDSFSLATFSID